MRSIHCSHPISLPHEYHMLKMESPTPPCAGYTLSMTSLTPIETATLERASDAPMLAQVERWAAVNSGTGNLHGLKTFAGLIADAFAVLPGALRLDRKSTRLNSSH